MNKQMYWGIAALMIILVAAGGFIYWQWSQVQQLKEQLAQDEKLLEEKNMPIVENNERPARPGYKLVPHGDHFHEVPVSAPDEWQDAPPEPSAQPVVTYTGPLTYHEELLKTNPVKALKLQSEERGHINAKWIPPFPHDDLEAQEYARSIYHFIYNKNSDIPVHGYDNTLTLGNEIAIKYDRQGARYADLQRLTWVNLEFDMGKYQYSSYGGLIIPSDYFPEHLSDLQQYLSDLKVLNR